MFWQLGVVVVVWVHLCECRAEQSVLKGSTKAGRQWKEDSDSGSVIEKSFCANEHSPEEGT